MLQKTLPRKPADFARGNVGATGAGQVIETQVLAHTWQADLALTPRIDSPDGSFWLDADRCTITELTLETSNEGPQGHSRLTYWQETTLSTFDGTDPMPVQPGQRLNVTVYLQGPPAGTPPGTLQATLFIDGASPPLQLQLQGEYIAVDPTTPIGQRWAAMGGAAVLGNPLDNEHDVADGSRQQDFDVGTLIVLPSGPVVFLDNAAQQAFQRVDSDDWNAFFAGLGLPTQDTIVRPDGVVLQAYDGAMMVVPSATAAPLVMNGAIYQHYLTLQGDLADPQTWLLLGYPDANPGDYGDATMQVFDGGYITWRVDVGAFEVHGAIAPVWMASAGALGLPVSDERGTPDGVGRYNVCEHGMVYWTPATGAHEIHGPILAQWAQAGYERGPLGYPTSDVLPWTSPNEPLDGVISSFQDGQLAWTPKLGVVPYPPAQATFTCQVLTPDGTALGGTVTVVVRSDGTYTLQGHMHDSGLDAYQYRVRALLTANADSVLMLQHSGTVGGTLGGGSRDDDWTEQGYNPWIITNWDAVQAGTFDVAKSYSDTGLLGTAEDMLHDLVSFLVLDVAVGPGLAVVIALGDELVSLTNTPVFGVGGLPGLVVSAGIVLCCGPGAIVMAAIAGVAVGAAVDALVRTRTPTGDELAFAASNVFLDTLPGDRLLLTNLTTPDGSKFTLPLIDGTIAVNLGAAFDTPTTWVEDGTGDQGDGYPSAGQVFIHELSHAWQIANETYIAGVVCHRETHPQEYSYGPPGPDWATFGLEQQASIVDQWFGGNWGNNPDGHVGRPIGCPHCDPNDAYFIYVANNVQLGNVS